MVGAEGRAGHLPLELSGPATRVARKTPIGVASSTLQRDGKRGIMRHGTTAEQQLASGKYVRDATESE